MGMYVYAFLVPKTRDRVVHKATTYRTYFNLTYIGAEGVQEITTPGLLYKSHRYHVGYFDNTRVYVMSVARYLELAQKFRDKADAEAGPDDASQGPCPVDDMTSWLEHGKPWDDFEIILIPEQ
jgi:hypothetical protein